MFDKPALPAMAAGVCWGSSGLVMRQMGAYGLDTAEIGALRLLVAALIVCAIALCRSSGMRIKPRQLPWLLVMGAGCLCLYSLCYVLAVQAISLSLTAVLIYTSPAIVMVLSVAVFHDPMTRGKAGALGLTFAGCCLVTGVISGAGEFSWRGVGFGLLAALLYALYTILAKIQTRECAALTVTAWSLLFGAVSAMLAVNIPHCLGVLRAAPAALLWAMLAGVVNTALPYLLYTVAVSRGEAGNAAMMACVEQVVATLLGAMVFHEIPGAGAIMGIMLVIAGLGVMTRVPPRQQTRPPRSLMH